MQLQRIKLKKLIYKLSNKKEVFQTTVAKTYIYWKEYVKSANIDPQSLLK